MERRKFVSMLSLGAVGLFVSKCFGLKKGKEEIQHNEGKLHREDGPAIICINNDRQEYFEEWFLNGKKHRKFGPATTGICFKDNKEKRWEEYWIDNRLISSGTQISGQTMWPNKIENKEMETIQ